MTICPMLCNKAAVDLEEHKLGEECSTYGTRKLDTEVQSESLKGRDHLGDTGIDRNRVRVDTCRMASSCKPWLYTKQRN
jgi:hypothetical protein